MSYQHLSWHHRVALLHLLRTTMDRQNPCIILFIVPQLGRDWRQIIIIFEFGNRGIFHLFLEERGKQSQITACAATITSSYNLLLPVRPDSRICNLSTSMATPSRLSYADLARKAQNIRSPNDVQRATTSSASSTSTVSTSFSKSNSNSTTPSSSVILGTRPPSPSLDTTDAKVPVVNVWNVRKEQMTASRTTTLMPSISTFLDDEDPFVVRMPLRPSPDNGDSWPEVGKFASNQSSSTNGTY